MDPAAPAEVRGGSLFSQLGRPPRRRLHGVHEGGTTIAGLHALERGGVRGALMDAVEAATRRATELGKVGS